MFDCVIVGAGITGLVAAGELVQRGKDVIVLEARDRIGGRIESIYVDGQLIETAGQWVAPGFDEMHALIEQAGLELIAPNDGALLVRSQGRLLRSESISDLDHILTPFEIADLGQGVLRFRRLAERIEKDPAWAGANAAWLGQPLRAWIKSNVRTPASQQDFTRMIETANTTPVDELTLGEALETNISGLDLESLFAATGRLKQRRVGGGMAKVTDYLADQLGHEHIKLNTEVTSIDHDAEKVVVHTRSGESFEAKSVLITLPPWMAAKLPYNPPLPAWRDEVVARTSPGSVIKAFVIYDTPWWREDGLSGQMSADEGMVQVSFDCTDDGKGVLMGFFEGRWAETVGGWTQAMRERAFIDALATIFGDKARQPHVYVDRDWAAEEFSQGSHGAHFSPGIWTANGQLLAEPVGRIHFAGSEYATKFNGYMEGAVLNARAEARSILRSLG